LRRGLEREPAEVARRRDGCNVVVALVALVLEEEEEEEGQQVSRG
jgi:hypothetical protein